MRRVHRAVLAMSLTLLVFSCAGGDATAVRVTLDTSQEQLGGLGPGSPLAGGTVRVYDGDVVIEQVMLDDEGRAELTTHGTFTVQAAIATGEPECFWGNSAYDVELPRDSLEIEVFQICSGD